MSSRVCSLSGKVIGVPGFLSIMFCFKGGDGCTWFPQEHVVFQER